MKRKAVFICLGIIVIVLYKLVEVVTPMKVVAGEIVVNSTDLMKNENEIDITELEMASEINEVLSSKVYFKQPLIKTWSRSEVEYEINLYEDRHHRGGVFRILINENVKTNTRYAYRSRLDVLDYRSISNIFNTDFSVSLSEEQVGKLLNILKKYDYY